MNKRFQNNIIINDILSLLTAVGYIVFIFIYIPSFESLDFSSALELVRPSLIVSIIFLASYPVLLLIQLCGSTGNRINYRSAGIVLGVIGFLCLWLSALSVFYYWFYLRKEFKNVGTFTAGTLTNQESNPE